MALWFIMSQKTEPKFIILGAASSIAIALICSRTLCMKGMKTDRLYYFTGNNVFRIIEYLCWLLVQIVKSAVYVSRISLSDRSEVDPTVVWFKADYDSPFARAMLANSITLTPGTITIDISEDGVYSVHALTNELKEGVMDGSMQARVARAFGEKIDFKPIGETDIKGYGAYTDAVHHREPAKYIARRKKK